MNWHLFNRNGILTALKPFSKITKGNLKIKRSFTILESQAHESLPLTCRILNYQNKITRRIGSLIENRNLASVLHLEPRRFRAIRIYKYHVTLLICGHHSSCAFKNAPFRRPGFAGKVIDIKRGRHAVCERSMKCCHSLLHLWSRLILWWVLWCLLDLRHYTDM